MEIRRTTAGHTSTGCPTEWSSCLPGLRADRGGPLLDLATTAPMEPDETAGHQSAAEAIATIARTPWHGQPAGGTGLRETAQRRVIGDPRGGPRSGPSAQWASAQTRPIRTTSRRPAPMRCSREPGRAARPGWAGALGTVFADQTWMGLPGRSAGSGAPRLGTVRDARDAACRYPRAGGGRRAGPGSRATGGPPGDRGRRLRPVLRAPHRPLDDRDLTDPVPTSTTTRRTTTASWSGRRLLGGAGDLSARRVRGSERGQYVLGGGWSGGHSGGAAGELII